MNRRVQILLVDDEDQNLAVLEAILHDPGYELLRAGNGDDALRTLLQSDVAAIVLDVKLPGMTGFELANVIKSTRRFRQVPILFLSAHHLDEVDVLAGYGAGGVDYLTRPINAAVLRHKVAVFAEIHRKSRALAELNGRLEERVQARTEELKASEHRLREANAELHGANAALREANRQKDVFLATLAHELRNPLAPLRTGIDLLVQQPEVPVGELGRTIGAMHRQIEHLVRLVDDLLEVSRISRGVLELRRQPSDLDAIIKGAIEATAPLLGSRRQSVRYDGVPSVYAHVDPVRIGQIVGNLLHNASKFSDEGSEILIELTPQEHTAAVRVIDRGIGILESELDRIFGVFSQVGAPGTSRGGLGIGLAVARQLAELHGGALTASSPGLGRGSTFTLTLEVTSTDGPQGSRGDAGDEPDASRPVQARLAIVVIEDHDDVRETLADWLRRMGHAVQVARTGAEGIDLVRTSCPQVVLCDIGMPGIDGVDVCREVKSTAMVQPVMIAMSGWGSEADRARTRAAGFDHHLVKPIAATRLREVLDLVRAP